MNRFIKMKNGVLAIGIVLWLCCGCTGPEAQNSFVKDASKSRVVKFQQSDTMEVIRLGTGRNFNFKGLAIDIETQTAYLGSWDKGEIVVDPVKFRRSGMMARETALNDTYLIKLKPGVMNKNDLLEIDNLTARFFNVFTNTDRKIPNVRDLENIFISQGTIINNTSGTPEVYSVEEFIVSREKILGSGDLTDFCEREISHKTETSGNIAQRFCSYEKSGNLNGEFFETKGTKTIQFVKVNGVWKMSSVAWSDER